MSPRTGIDMIVAQMLLKVSPKLSGTGRIMYMASIIGHP
jgi:hypothetical protein